MLSTRAHPPSHPDRITLMNESVANPNSIITVAMATQKFTPADVIPRTTFLLCKQQSGHSPQVYMWLHLQQCHYG